MFGLAYRKISLHFELLQQKDDRLESISFLEVFMNINLFHYSYIIFPFFINGEAANDQELKLIKSIKISIIGFWLFFGLILLTSLITKTPANTM